MVESKQGVPLVELSDDDRARMIDAINAADRKVTIGDVVNKTGLPANAVANALRDMAFDSKAHILVDANGNVAYRFKKRFERRLKIHPLKFLGGIVGAIFNLYSLFIKSLFGLSLFLAFWSFVFPLLLAAVIKSTVDFWQLQDTADARRGLLDFKNWPGIFRAITTTEIKHGGKTIKSNILLDCYSFVFGDGDPNLDLDERKWQHIAQLIEHNQGVLTCEQLSPYIGKKATEDDMIPVMVRFNGTPEVTSSGELAYVFSLMSVNTDAAKPSTERPHCLQERYWTWTGISGTSKALIFTLAFANALTVVAIAGVCYHIHSLYATILAPLFLLIMHNFHLFWEIIAVVFHVLGLWGVIGSILMLLILAPFMLFISLFFFIYPPMRVLAVQIRNIGIWHRNRRRQMLADNLASPAEPLVLKLSQAKECLPEKIKIDEKHLAFDSSRDSVEQQFDELHRSERANHLQQGHD